MVAGTDPSDRVGEGRLDVRAERAAKDPGEGRLHARWQVAVNEPVTLQLSAVWCTDDAASHCDGSEEQQRTWDLEPGSATLQWDPEPVRSSLGRWTTVTVAPFDSGQGGALGPALLTFELPPD